MAKIETERETKESPAAKGTRFDDLWAVSDAEIAAGMKTLDLAEIEQEVAERRGLSRITRLRVIHLDEL